MFTAPLWCLLFGATICLAVKDESPENRREMNKALGKQFLKMLGLKKLPKLSEEAKEKVREAQNKQDRESKEKGDLAVRTTPSNPPDCARHSFTVNFREIYGSGNFVVQPASYNAYQCKGECPFPLYAGLNSTNHATIQTLAHTIDSNSVPAACCVPTTLQPTTILYFDDNSVLQSRVWEDMVVEGCGCR